MATGRLNTPSQLAATTNTTVYTVPSGFYAVFNVSMTNITTSSVTIRLAISTSGTPGSSEWIEYDTVVLGKGVFERTGLVLDANKTVVAWASAGSAVNVTVYGIETSLT
jgi:hypothetical protein